MYLSISLCIIYLFISLYIYLSIYLIRLFGYTNQVNPKCDMYFQILRTLIRGTDGLFKIHEPDQRVPSAIATDIDEYEISDDEHVNNTTIGIKRKSQDISVEQQLLLLLRSLVEEKENDNQNKQHEKSFGAKHAAVPADADEDNGEQENRVHDDDEDNSD